MAPITGNVAGQIAYDGTGALINMALPEVTVTGGEWTTLPGGYATLGDGFGNMTYQTYTTLGTGTTAQVYQNVYPYQINLGGTITTGGGLGSYQTVPYVPEAAKRDRLTCRLKVPGFGRHHMPEHVNLPELEQSMRKLAASLLSKSLPKERTMFQSGRQLSLDEIKGEQSPIEFLIPAQCIPTELTPEQVELASVEDTTEGRIFVFSYKPEIEHAIDVEITQDIIQECIKLKKLALVKNQIHKNLKPLIHEHLKKNPLKNPLPMTAIEANEIKARETLRDMITESEWRRYVTNGFIMVKAPSGLWYQLFKDRSRLRVYYKARHIESLCIYTDGECPPTDHVINMKLMIEMDEQALRKSANVYPAGPEGEAMYGRAVRYQNDPTQAMLLPTAKKSAIVKPAATRSPTIVEMYKQLQTA